MDIHNRKQRTINKREVSFLLKLSVTLRFGNVIKNNIQLFQCNNQKLLTISNSRFHNFSAC